MTRLVLASSSPRRRELLAAAGYQFEVVTPSPEAEGEQHDGESPADYVARMARQKAADVAHRLVRDGTTPLGQVSILGCDTVVVCKGKILGKPSSLQDARAMLQTLRGTEHFAISGLCLWRLPANVLQEQVESTTLRMAEINDAAIQEYLNSGLWQGKAGGFGFQDRTGWLEIVAGSETNVVGLPLEALAEMLHRIAG
jgi:septum formation protein